MKPHKFNVFLLCLNDKNVKEAKISSLQKENEILRKNRNKMQTQINEFKVCNNTYVIYAILILIYIVCNNIKNVQMELNETR